MAHVILIGVRFVAAMVCIVGTNLMFYQILDEVNAKLPPEPQIGFLLVSLRMFGILDQHAGFFASSAQTGVHLARIRIYFAFRSFSFGSRVGCRALVPARSQKLNQFLFTFKAS
jgi:hypothetical protein